MAENNTLYQIRKALLICLIAGGGHQLVWVVGGMSDRVVGMGYDGRSGGKMPCTAGMLRELASLWQQLVGFFYLQETLGCVSAMARLQNVLV